MNREEFEKEIRKYLAPLSREEVVRFAWRCGVRALPYLGAKGDFKFWKPVDRQQNLYAVLKALDVVGDAFTIRPARAIIYADAAANTADNSLDLSISSSIYSIAVAARAAYAYARTARAIDAAIYAIDASQKALQSIILEDVKTINQAQPSISISSYGAVWEQFQAALEAEGCAYWGRLYQDIFDRNFALDPEALKRRLNVPEEIQKQGAAAVADFLESLEAKSTRPLSEAKILILGQGAVGKTSLLKRILVQPFDSFEATTHGINIDPWHFTTDQDQRIQVNLWDFGGQEIMHATHQFFLTKRSLYILVLDARKGENESNLHYWLKLIQSYGGDSPVLVVVNKCDEFETPLNETRLLKDYAPNIKDFIYTSAKTGKGIEELRNQIKALILDLPHVFDEVPRSYFIIKQALEKKAREKDYLSIAAYRKICKQHGLDQAPSQKVLIRFLHDLGSILNFDDPDDPYQLNDTNVLNPEWVTGAVYRILNSPGLMQKEGELELEDLGRVLDDADRYPASKHAFILGIMRKFELCFKFPKSTSYLIPELLSVREPDLDWNKPDILRFQFHYNVLPTGLISRLIVRGAQYLEKRPVYWRSGVVFKINANRCMVRANTNEGRIYIQITENPRKRRSALQRIREELNAIHQTIPQLVVKEKIPLPDEPDILVDPQHLLLLEEMGQSHYVPEGARRKYDVNELLTGIQSKPGESPPTLYLLRLKLKNIRCFKQLDLDFSANRKPRPVTLLLGDNGVGKTTILRSIALGICDQTTASSLMEDLEGDFLRTNCEEGSIELQISDRKSKKKWTMTTRLTREGKNVILKQDTSDDLPVDQLFACGYGALRGHFNAESFEQFDKSDSLRSLFDYRASLQNPELIFRRMEAAKYDLKALFKKISEILLLDQEGGIRMDAKGIQMKGSWGSFTTIGAIGDGYQATLAWLTDFIGWAFSFDDGFITAPFAGLVFVDEIEKHLHPRWQRQIIQQLHTQFPNVQFIVSSHSPICAGGIADLEAGKGSLFHLSPNQEDVQPLEVPAGWRYDQILTSAAFGLSSARDVSTEKILDELRILHEKYGEEAADQEDFQKKLAELEGRSVTAAQDELDRQRRIELIEEVKSLKALMKEEQDD